MNEPQDLALRPAADVAARIEPTPIAAAMPGLQRPAIALTLFVIAHTLLSVDRGITSILMEPIRREFALSDAQLALLFSVSFALFFGAAGIPIGRLVDKANRRAVLAGSVFLFSAMTAVSGLAGGFGQLFLARSLVGAGEAGGGPAMGSMIADLYPRERRASALATYYIGTPLGSILAFLAGGWIAAHDGWRTALVAAGLPGVALALILLLFVQEPRRRVDAGGATASVVPGLGETFRFIWSQRALCHVLMTPMLTSGATAGVFVFAGSFYVRTHGLTLPQVGLLLAVFYGSLGVIGTLAGGRLVDRLARRDERWRSWYCALANLLAAPAVTLMVLAPTFALSAIGLGLFAILTMSTYGPLLALMQSLSPARMRGTVTALFYLGSYLVGAAGGPQLIGVVSDLLRPAYGEQSLRYAILAATLLYLWGGLHFLLSARHLRRDLAAAAAR